jgi:hypothetical protein
MKTALVTPFDPPTYFVEDFICFQSELKDSFMKIKNYEFQNNKQFDSILFINEVSVFSKENVLLNLLTKDVSKNQLYCLDYYVGLNTNECSINTHLFYCNSYVFSTLSNYHRTESTMFGEIFNHNIKLEKVFL